MDMGNRLSKVLVVCTHNDARSQMAEALFKKHGAEHFEFFSAGLKPTTVHPCAIKIMQDNGIDISDNRAKNVKEFLGRLQVRYLITVCQNTERYCPMIFMDVRKRFYWPTEDPVEFAGDEKIRLEKFRKVYDSLEERVENWLWEYVGKDTNRFELPIR
jgi:arsenate reductase (thioredoxin)